MNFNRMYGQGIVLLGIFGTVFLNSFSAWADVEIRAYDFYRYVVNEQARLPTQLKDQKGIREAADRCVASIEEPGVCTRIVSGVKTAIKVASGAVAGAAVSGGVGIAIAEGVGQYYFPSGGYPLAVGILYYYLGELIVKPAILMGGVFGGYWMSPSSDIEIDVSSSQYLAVERVSFDEHYADFYTKIFGEDNKEYLKFKRFIRFIQDKTKISFLRDSSGGLNLLLPN